MRSVDRSAALGLVLLVGSGCSAKANPPSSPPCDQTCQDGVALRALRSSLTIVYNKAFAQPPAAPTANGQQDTTVACDSTHTVHLFGSAQSDPVQAVTRVDLTYDVSGCPVNATDGAPAENYNLEITGLVTQEGTIFAQGSGSTALVIRAASITFSGTVYDPATAYDESCQLDVVQNGNNISGRLCDRVAGTSY